MRVVKASHKLPKDVSIITATSLLVAVFLCSRVSVTQPGVFWASLRLLGLTAEFREFSQSLCRDSRLCLASGLTGGVKYR